MSTATATDIETLAGLDFEVSCEVKHILLPSGAVMYRCKRPAVWSAAIHQQTTHEWVPRFLCDSCMVAVAQTPCKCGEDYRIREPRRIGVQ